jgi:hypothetical protein
LGGIVEARAEHKNFLTKYHRSFCSNVQNVQIVQNVQMLCAKQESFFAQEKKGCNQLVFNIFSMPTFDEFNYWYIFSMPIFDEFNHWYFIRLFLIILTLNPISQE